MADAAALPDRPAIRPALAISAAWLFFWPYQLPWYDAMIICLLLLYPASRLDWLVLARLTAGTISNMPGNPYLHRGHILNCDRPLGGPIVAPAVILAAAVGLVGLCVSGRWNLRDAPGLGRAGIAGAPSDPGLLAADRHGPPCLRSYHAGAYGLCQRCPGGRQPEDDRTWGAGDETTTMGPMNESQMLGQPAQRDARRRLVVVVVDGSPGSGEALRQAASQARQRNALLDIVYVVPAARPARRRSWPG